MADDARTPSQPLPTEDRIALYERQLEQLRSPRNYRERVLRNVYRSLIEECREQVQKPPD